MVGYGLINLMLSFIILACISSLISSGKSKNMTSLYLACISAFLALFINSLHYFITSDSLRIIFHEAKWLLYIFTPNFALIYLLNKYYDKRNNIKRSMIVLVSLMIVEFLLLITDSLHHFIRKEIIIPKDSVSIIITNNNIGFYIISFIQFSVFVFAIIFLFSQVKKHFKKDKQLIKLVILTFCIPIIGSPVYILTSGHINATYDWSFPLYAIPVIGISMIEIYTNIVKRTSYARGGMFESVPFPIILIDNNGFIIDINTSASKLNISIADKISQTKIFHDVRSHSPITWHNKEVHIGNNTYKIYASYIDDDPSKKIKDISLILHDVTALNEYIDILEYNTYHDLLTGVYNRKWFDKHKNSFLQFSNYPLGIVMTDVNMFKQINDNFGHEAGDKALVYFSKVMKESFPINSYIFRFGGDEFLVLVPNTSEDKMKQIVLNFTFNLSKSTITAAVGYTLRYDDYINIEKNIKEADILMYSDKDEFYKNQKQQ